MKLAVLDKKNSFLILLKKPTPKGKRKGERAPLSTTSNLNPEYHSILKSLHRSTALIEILRGVWHHGHKDKQPFEKLFESLSQIKQLLPHRLLLCRQN